MTVADAMLESYVEAHLVKVVKAASGFVRKMKWIACRGAPDRFVAMPKRGMWLVELKRPGGALEEHQVREHARLVAAGVNVVVLDSIEAVDAFMVRTAPKGETPCGS